MLSREQAQAEVKKHGSVSAAARALKVPRSTLQHWLEGTKRAPDGAVRPRAGKSLAEFRQLHDKSFIVPQKIRDALKALGSGWEYEINFLKLAGLSTTDLANYRDAFAEHIVVVDRTKRVWAGSKELAAKLREMSQS